MTGKHLTVSLLLLLMSVVMLSSTVVQPASASPAYSSVMYGPTANTDADSIGTNDANAYNWNFADYATISNSIDSLTYGFDMQLFAVTPRPNSTVWTPYHILQVDIKIDYSTTAQTGNDLHKIDWRVEPSTTWYVLQDWVYLPGRARAVDSWLGRVEPNDGVWDWTDLTKIHVRFLTDKVGGADGRSIYLYEVWAQVKIAGPAQMKVVPQTQSVSAPFDIDVNITEGYNVYSWSFNLTYDTTKITTTQLSYTEGGFLSAGGTTQFGNLTDEASGEIYLYASLVGDVNGVSGIGTLVTIHFTLDAAGTSTLDLHDTTIVEYDFVAKKSYNLYQSNPIDGSVTVTAVPEFPLGFALELALIAPIIYIALRKRPKKFMNTLPTK